MIAAIYARKSTEQHGIADEQKSVARQVEHACAFAASKGWHVADEHVYVDDGISGAEFANRPGFVRLMNALTPRPRFDVLVMSEESRLGREAIETAYALKQLITKGVRVFFYLEDRERTLDSPMDKVMLSLTTFADELEREKARQRVTDSMVRKARAGHVCGGRTFGYDNLTVTGPNGERSHVERRINNAEAAVVVRIFEMCATGYGLVRIAKTLNEDGAPSPRAQQGRPCGWAASTVREILYRPIYRGEIVWNQTRKRDRWGRKNQTARSANDWITVPAPQLRIVSEERWAATHARLSEARAAYLRGTDGKVWGRPERTIDSKYLLAGITRCAVCNGSVYVKSRDHGKRRVFFYGCTSFHQRGRSVCWNGLEIRMERLDEALLSAIEHEVLHPDVVEFAIDRAAERLRPSQAAVGAERAHLEEQLGAVRTELERLTAAIIAGGELTTLMDAIKTREATKATIQSRIDLLDTHAALGAMSPQALRTDLRGRIDEWRGLLRRHVPQARQILKKLFPKPLLLGPDGDGFALRGQASLQKIVLGVGAITVASPTVPSWNQLAVWLTEMRSLRDSCSFAA